MKSLKRDSLHRGFTLIELLISIGILSLVTGLSLASFSRITANQNLTSAENNLVTVLQTAKSHAQSQYKDPRCDDFHTITYWYVELFNSTSYQIAIQCINWSLPATDPNYAVAFSSKVYTLPSGVTFSSPYQVTWFAVGAVAQSNNANVIFWQGKNPITTPTTITISLTSSYATKTVSIYSDGRIIAQ